MQDLLEQAKKMPDTPGCYLFKDEGGGVLYVGKAKNIRKRVGQYFGADKRAQLPFLIADACQIDFISTTTELEAIFLESTLIKKHNPKYNIDLKDDKSFAFIKIDYTTEIPQITYTRNPDLKRGAKNRESLFGPYSSVKKIRDTLDLVRRIFTFCANEAVSTRPCFYFHLHRCPGVCIGQISLDEYQKHLHGIKLFLNGQTREVRQDIESAMHKAAKEKQFEKAARLRDQLQGLDMLHEKQVAQVGKNANWDIVNLFAKSAYACVNILKLRNGKLIDSENFVLNNFGQIPEKLILETFLEKYLANAQNPATEIFTPATLSNKEMLEAILQQNGFKAKLKIAKDSQVKKLVNLSKLNAEQFLEKQQKSLAQDKDVLMSAMVKLQEILHLPTLPRRIECFDMSNIQGTNPVGSMVVFINGQPAKSEYKKFKVRSKDTPDDFAMMEEVLTRRLAHLQVKKTDHDSQLPGWPTPDLIVIDGGKGQLKAGLKAQRIFNSKFSISNEKKLQTKNYKLKTLSREPLENVSTPPNVIPSAVDLSAEAAAQEKGSLNFKNERDSSTSLRSARNDVWQLAIPMIGLAKRLEEIYQPNSKTPILLSHDDPALQLLQRLRDEAHRFAITFHRQLRSKSAIKSELDSIKGIGPKTKKLLKARFGTVAQIKSASPEELAEVAGKVKARLIKERL